MVFVTVFIITIFSFLKLVNLILLINLKTFPIKFTQSFIPKIKLPNFKERVVKEDIGIHLMCLYYVLG